MFTFDIVTNMNYKPQNFANYFVVGPRGYVTSTVHFPLVCATGYFFKQNYRDDSGRVRRRLMHVEASEGRQNISEAFLTNEAAVCSAFEFSNRDSEVIATSHYEYDFVSKIEQFRIHFKRLDKDCNFIDEEITVSIERVNNENAIIWHDFTHATQIGVLYNDGTASVNSLDTVVKNERKAA